MTEHDDTTRLDILEGAVSIDRIDRASDHSWTIVIGGLGVNRRTLREAIDAVGRLVTDGPFKGSVILNVDSLRPVAVEMIKQPSWWE
jgi:hypothetical protein